MYKAPVGCRAIPVPCRLELMFDGVLLFEAYRSAADPLGVRGISGQEISEAAIQKDS